MLKMVVRVVLSGIVLASGLVSCAPDGNKNVVKDVYVAKAPKIQRASGAAFLLEKSNESELTVLDLRDAFDFTESAPHNVQIMSTCSSSNRPEAPLIWTSNFSGKQRIPVYQTLQSVVTTNDFSAVAFGCSFEVRLSNAAGSSHILNIKTVRLKDEQPSKITLDRNGAIETKITFRQTDDVNLRYPDPTSLQAQLICQDATFDPVTFTSVMPLSWIDWDRAIKRDPKTAVNISIRPRQRCRVLLKSQNESVELSGPLEIHFPWKPISAEIHLTPFTPVGPGQVFTMFHIRLTNPESVNRVVMYDAKKYDVATNAYLKGAAFSDVAYRFVHINLVSWDESDGRTIPIHIPANGSIDVPVLFTYFRGLNCPHDTDAHDLTVIAPIVFKPLSVDGTPDAPIELKSLPTISINRPGFNRTLYKPTPNVGPNRKAVCSWG